MIQPQIGVIGGSGLYELDGLHDLEIRELDTPFGKPSDALRIGTINGQGIAFLSRHGVGHQLAPSEVPYAANICAMKMLGVKKVISLSAVGSLDESIAPRSLVIPSNIIDRTVGRTRSFFGDGIVAHVSLANPFCADLSDQLTSLAEAHGGGLPVHSGGAYVCIEGPQFSTRAESDLFRSWGASVIGMTAFPETRFAREAELCYACLAMVTDYDVWHDVEEEVSVQVVINNLDVMARAAQTIVSEFAKTEVERCDAGCADALANTIMTDPTLIPKATLERIEPIAGRYLPTSEHLP